MRPADGGAEVRLVLITRPREQAEATARLVEAMGYRALIDPVLDIRPLPLPALDLSDVAAIALTSANAAPALAELNPALPIYAVGGVTAAAARSAGARRLRVAEGDGRALAGLIRRELTPEAGAILHLAGADVREGLAEALTAAGFTYRQATVYAAVPTGALAPATRQALDQGTLHAVLLFSPRSADLWVRMVVEAGLEETLRNVVACCLSEAVAEPLRLLPFGDVRIAVARDQKALIRCLEATP